MNKLRPFLLLALCAAAAPSPPPESAGRIVGGHPARAGSAPWQAEIYSTYAYTEADISSDRALSDSDPAKLYLAIKPDWERLHRCGGAYIGDGWVVTAAHCVLEVTGDFLHVRRVRLGTQDLAQGGSNWRIERAAVHKDYDGVHHLNDIALIRVARDDGAPFVTPARVAPIRLIGDRPRDRPLQIGDRVSVTGWGLTGARDAGSMARARDGSLERASPVLMQVGLAIEAQGQCEKIPEYAGGVADSVICAGSAEAGRDSCNGDSGGPLTRAQGRGRVLVGLVSWGKGCGLADTPGIYTRISAYREWIDRARKAPAGQVSRM